MINHIIYIIKILALAKELYEAKYNLSNQIMQETFEKHQNLDYSLIFQADVVLPGFSTTYFCLHSLAYVSSNIRNVAPNEIKISLSLDEFKIKIEQ